VGFWIFGVPFFKETRSVELFFFFFFLHLSCCAPCVLVHLVLAVFFLSMTSVLFSFWFSWLCLLLRRLCVICVFLSFFLSPSVNERSAFHDLDLFPSRVSSFCFLQV
jgi:hypothetical protein